MCLELTFSPMLLKMIKLPGVIKHLRKASNMKEKKTIGEETNLEETDYAG